MNLSLPKTVSWLRAAREWLLWPVRRAPFFFVFVLLLFSYGHVVQVVNNLAIGNDVAVWRGIKSLVVVTVVVYLLTCLAARFKHLKPVLYGLALLLKFVALFVRHNFMVDINPVILQAVVETDSGEASDFVRTYALTPGTIKDYIYIGISIVFIIAGERLLPRFKNWLNRGWERWVLATLLLVALPYGAYHVGKQVSLFAPSAIFDDIFVYYEKGPTDPLSCLTHATLVVKNVEKEAKREYAVTAQAYGEPIECEETDTLRVVVVIGETYIKRHAGVYGYELPTTPRLQAELESGNLLLMDDIIAGHCNTSASIKRLMSTNSDADGEPWQEYPFFPTLFKKAGYYVTYWDNQWDRRKVNIYDATLGAIVHNKLMTPYCYDLENGERYDFDQGLFESYYNEAHRKAMGHRLSLVMFHLMGQHMFPNHRFPDETKYKHFTPSSYHRTEPWLTREKLQRIADYDNATRYNDALMGQLIDSLRTTCAVLVYFSDHGEEVYDWQDFAGRDERPARPLESMKLQCDVPFMVWCSPQFRSRYPEVVERLRAARDRKGVLDDLPHLLLDLGQVKSKYYVKERDLISPSYKPSKRFVQDIVDYDEVVNRRSGNSVP